MKNMIITIGRQYGSGGREIGEKLAERLDIPYYDTLLLDKTTENSGLPRTVIERYDEQMADKWLHLSLASGVYDTEHLPVPLRAALSQFEAIHKIAEHGSAVMIGRCADYVLRDRDNVLSVFVHADIGRRIERVMKRNNISRAEAEKRIRNTDKHRASYYNFYTDKAWGNPDSYHLCVDSSMFGIDKTVEVLLAGIQLIF